MDNLELEGLEGEDPLGDLIIQVKQEPDWMGGRGNNGGGGRSGGIVSRKRANKRGKRGLGSKRNKVEGEDSQVDHCIFCLRKTGGDGQDCDVVPRATVNPSMAPNLLQTFNQIWPYLQQHKFEDSDNLLAFVERNAGKSDKVPSFTELPTMCQSCADKLKSVDKLMISLWKQMKDLSGIVQESKRDEQRFLKTDMFENHPSDSSFSEQQLVNKEPENPHGVNSSSDGEPPAETMDDFEDNSTGFENEDEIQPDYIKVEQPEANSEAESVESSEPEVPAKRSRGRPKKTGMDRSVVCNICDQRYSCKQSLTRHKKEVHEKEVKPSRHKCDLCGDLILVKDLYKHLRNHVGEEYLIKCPCPKCPLRFTQTASICRHLERSKTCRDGVPPGVPLPQMIYNCEVCGYSTGNALNLRSHLTQNHENPTKNFPCPVTGCGQGFTLKQSVVLHLPHHDFCSGVTTQRCPVCDELTKVKKMEDHLQDKHQVPEIIKCKQCSFHFSTREQLIEHLYDHRYGDLLCDICQDGVKYSRHSNLQDHYFTVHKIGIKFSCEQCEDSFWKKANLEDHVKRIHKREESVPKKKKVYRCEECDVEYKSPLTLTAHNMRCHGAEQYNCRFCSERFTRMDILSKHMREHRGVTTGGPKEFKCEVEGCGQIFSKKKNLTRHHKAHHLGVRHVCEICGKSYTEKAGLKGHHEIAHLGLRPYICDVCGESFTASTVLKRHKLVHTGDRPFACEICGQRFRHKEVLKTHLEGHERKGSDFKPNGPMKQVRKRVERNN